MLAFGLMEFVRRDVEFTRALRVAFGATDSKYSYLLLTPTRKSVRWCMLFFFVVACEILSCSNISFIVSFSALFSKSLLSV